MVNETAVDNQLEEQLESRIPKRGTFYTPTKRSSKEIEELKLRVYIYCMNDIGTRAIYVGSRI